MREAIELVFRKFNELGSTRRLFFWLSTEKIQLPAAADGTGNEVRWRTPRYHSLLSLLQRCLGEQECSGSAHAFQVFTEEDGEGGALFYFDGAKLSHNYRSGVG